MSNKKQSILQKIAQLFNSVEGDGLEHKLSDGSVLKMDKQEKGGKVTINDAAAKAQTYELPNGTKITCDANGVITEVKQKFTDYTLADGTVLSIDNLAVGGMCTVNGSPAPASDYTLPDGTVVTVDAAGMITAVVPAAEPPMDMTTPEGMKKAYDKFANGTIDPANMSIIIKALMEYTFGWQLREAEEKANRDAALKAYQESMKGLPAQVQQQQKLLKEMFALMNEIVELPTGDAPPADKKKFSFANVEGRKKSFEKFQAAAKQLNKEYEKMKIA